MGKNLIIIGSGITGLTAGLGWSKVYDTNENPVTIIEKEPKVGGYVTSFERKGYIFDTSQMIPDIMNMLKFFDIKISLKKFKGYFMRLFIVDPKTGKQSIINLPSGKKEFTEFLIERYPEEKANIIKFMNYSESMFNELSSLKTEVGILDLMKILISCRKIVKNSGKTFKEYFELFNIKNKELEEIFNVNAAFSGLPETSVAAILPLGAMFYY